MSNKISLAIVSYDLAEVESFILKEEDEEKRKEEILELGKAKAPCRVQVVDLQVTAVQNVLSFKERVEE